MIPLRPLQKNLFYKSFDWRLFLKLEWQKLNLFFEKL